MACNRLLDAGIIYLQGICLHHIFDYQSIKSLYLFVSFSPKLAAIMFINLEGIHRILCLSFNPFFMLFSFDRECYFW